MRQEGARVRGGMQAGMARQLSSAGGSRPSDCKWLRSPDPGPRAEGTAWWLVQARELPFSMMVAPNFGGWFSQVCLCTMSLDSPNGGARCLLSVH